MVSGGGNRGVQDASMDRHGVDNRLPWRKVRIADGVAACLGTVVTFPRITCPSSFSPDLISRGPTPSRNVITHAPILKR